MKSKKFSEILIKNISKLSNLLVDPKESNYFKKQFNQTLKIINQLNELNTENILGTSQVTGMKNVFREDIVDKERMLTQKQALSQSKKTYKGYFIVESIFDDK